MSLVVFLYFFILLYFIYKSIKGSSLIYSLTSTFVYILIINGILSWIMYILDYKLTDFVLISSYFILIVFIIFLNKLDKNYIFIKTEVNSLELIFLLISILLFTFFFYIRFQNGNSISFETTDPVVHYDLFKTYFKNRELMLSIPSDIYSKMSDYPVLFYVNCAIFYSMFPFLKDYNFYILFNIFLCFISSLLFFHLLISKTKLNFKSYILASILTIVLTITLIYSLLIFGFSSQIIALAIIIEIMIISNNTNNKYFYLKSNFLLVGVLLSYYYYFPMIVLSLLITIYIKENEIFNSIYSFFKAICLAIIFYYIVFVLFNVEPAGGKAHLINTEGYIFRDLYSTLIVFIPMSLITFYMFIKYKKKEFIFDNIIFIFSILFSLLLFIMAVIFGRVSSYYFFKNHLMIYLVLLNSSFIFLYFYSKLKYTTVVGIISILIFLSLKPLEDYRINSNKQIINNILLNLNLFNENYRFLFKEAILNKEQLKYISSECHTFYKTSDVLQSLWIYSMTGCNPKYFQAPGNTSFDNVREFYNNNNNIDTTNLDIKVIDLRTIKEKNINE